MQCNSEYLDDPLASDLSIANLDSIFPDWKRPPADKTIVGWERPDPRPWPTDDPIAQLVWLATSGAKLWVPTLKQLHELREQRINAARHPNSVPAQARSERQLLNEVPRERQPTQQPASYFDRVIPEVKP